MYEKVKLVEKNKELSLSLTILNYIKWIFIFEDLMHILLFILSSIFVFDSYLVLLFIIPNLFISIVLSSYSASDEFYNKYEFRKKRNHKFCKNYVL